MNESGQSRILSDPQDVRRPKWILYMACTTAIVLILSAFTGWFFFIHQDPDKDPFSETTLSVLPFPVYYPSYLPPHFRIDAKTVTEPTTNVIVVTLLGPTNQKVYISQEARPGSFNFTGFYSSFKDLKETSTNLGTIAVGLINNNITEIGSLATDKTWLVTNTTAHLPLAQLTLILKSLLVSH